MKMKSMIFNFLIPMNLLPLGGLPSFFLGFIPKLIMIQLFSYKMIFTLLMLLLSKLIMSYFYLRLFTPMLLLSFSFLSLTFTSYPAFPSFSILMFFLLLSTYLESLLSFLFSNLEF